MFIVSLHYFTDDKTLSSFTKTIDHLVKIIESESNCVIERFDEIKMIVSPHKVQAILLEKRKSDLTD